MSICPFSLLFLPSPLQARGELVQGCIDILHVYRKKCASATSSGQLILPESLKLLPLYTLSLLKVRRAGSEIKMRV